ncbi:DgyrCDS1377 [Dimorphilus gyrociliatus]|uniref:DgyrCDS1377 n=1 Tax=Dimorphilus gyrociliatus TaxID=2664684 RepID=A0A7I8V724_9ANNE|nr:DgyrCDS1377 [Dimorphilus gyrociliatus]
MKNKKKASIKIILEQIQLKSCLFVRDGQMDDVDELLIFESSECFIDTRTSICNLLKIAINGKKALRKVSVYHSFPIRCYGECEEWIYDIIFERFSKYLKIIITELQDKNKKRISLEADGFNSFKQCPKNHQMMSLFRKGQTIRTIYCLQCEKLTFLDSNRRPLKDLRQPCILCPFNAFYNVNSRTCEICPGHKLHSEDTPPSGSNSAVVCSIYDDISSMNHYATVLTNKRKPTFECWPWYMRIMKNSYNLIEVKYTYGEEITEVSESLSISLGYYQHMENFNCTMTLKDSSGFKFNISIVYIVQEVYPDALANYFEEEVSICPGRSRLKQIELSIRRKYFYYRFIRKITTAKTNPVHIKIECGRRLYKLESIHRNLSQIDDRQLYEYEPKSILKENKYRIRVWIIYQLHSSVEINNIKISSRNAKRDIWKITIYNECPAGYGLEDNPFNLLCVRCPQSYHSPSGIHRCEKCELFGICSHEENDDFFNDQVDIALDTTVVLINIWTRRKVKNRQKDTYMFYFADLFDEVPKMPYWFNSSSHFGLALLVNGIEHFALTDGFEVVVYLGNEWININQLPPIYEIEYIDTQALINHQGSEVEDQLKKMMAHKGVVGVMIVNSDGVPIRTTLDNSTTVQHAALIQQLVTKAKSVIRDLDPSNELSCLRVRSRKNEIIITPEKDYVLIVVQNATTET